MRGKLPTPEHALALAAYTCRVLRHIHRGRKKPFGDSSCRGQAVALDYTDSDQPRPIKLEGNRLEIGDGKTWRRMLGRVH
jgi:hypothetical protein